MASWDPVGGVGLNFLISIPLLHGVPPNCATGGEGVRVRKVMNRSHDVVPHRHYRRKGSAMRPRGRDRPRWAVAAPPSGGPRRRTPRAAVLGRLVLRPRRGGGWGVAGRSAERRTSCPSAAGHMQGPSRSPSARRRAPPRGGCTCAPSRRRWQWLGGGRGGADGSGRSRPGETAWGNGGRGASGGASTRCGWGPQGLKRQPQRQGAPLRRAPGRAASSNGVSGRSEPDGVV